MFIKFMDKKRPGINLNFTGVTVIIPITLNSTANISFRITLHARRSEKKQLNGYFWFHNRYLKSAREGQILVLNLFHKFV